MRGSARPVGPAGGYATSFSPPKSFGERRKQSARLSRQGKRNALADDFSSEGEPRCPGELHHQVPADQRGIAGNHHRLEVARSRLEEATPPRRLFDEDFPALAKQAEVADAVSTADRRDEAREPLTCRFVVNCVA